MFLEKTIEVFESIPLIKQKVALAEIEETPQSFRVKMANEQEGKKKQNGEYLTRLYSLLVTLYNTMISLKADEDDGDIKKFFDGRLLKTITKKEIKTHIKTLGTLIEEMEAVGIGEETENNSDDDELDANDSDDSEYSSEDFDDAEEAEDEEESDNGAEPVEPPRKSHIEIGKLVRAHGNPVDILNDIEPLAKQAKTADTINNIRSKPSLDARIDAFLTTPIHSLK